MVRATLYIVGIENLLNKEFSFNHSWIMIRGNRWSVYIRFVCYRWCYSRHIKICLFRDRRYVFFDNFENSILILNLSWWKIYYYMELMSTFNFDTNNIAAAFLWNIVMKCNSTLSIHIISTISYESLGSAEIILTIN